MPSLKLFSICLLLLTSFYACRKIDPSPDKLEVNMETLDINPDFDYQMTEQYHIEIKILDYQDAPISDVVVEFYHQPPEEGGLLFAKGKTSIAGKYLQDIELPKKQRSIYVRLLYVGIPNTKTLELSSSQPLQRLTFGGSEALKTMPSKEEVVPYQNSYKVVNNLIYNYISSYDSDGKPHNLLNPDILDANFLSEVNASLPEGQPVPQFNPAYLNTGNNTVIELSQEADIWVTFVSEGAGYKNSLAYYTYDINSPPQSIMDIDSLNIVFPNMSFPNSGGNLTAGAKLLLGRFPAGTGIAWALIANGWSSANQSVGSGNNIFYAHQSLNPETSVDYQQHNVILWDDARRIMLIGFEDLLRYPTGGSDEDFNDAIFYASATPYTAISNRSSFLSTSTTAIDSDGDGVSDSSDDYPNDPLRAFDRYYPSSNSYGSLGFEDLWPTKGDYDCNDLVVDYRFQHIANAQNEIYEIKGEIVLQAIGAAQHNALAFELGIPASQVQSVVGTAITRSYLNFDANGCESGQNNAVFYIFDDAHDLMPPPTGFTVNTEEGKIFQVPDTIRVNITLNQALDEQLIGLPPYNPFIVCNRDRDREVHLPNYSPTTLANLSLFNTADDDSDPQIGRYYKNDLHLPWALHFPVKFDYPKEKIPIIQAHLEFRNWAESNGIMKLDWFENKNTYRDDNKIYQR